MVDFHVYYHPDAEMTKRLDEIAHGVSTLIVLFSTIIIPWRTQMSAELDALIAQVTESQEVEASAVMLIQGIAQQLKDALANNDLPKLAELTEALDGSANALAAAIAANTPTTPV